jgi:hypothetical protein
MNGNAGQKKKKVHICTFAIIVQLTGTKIDFFFEGEKYFHRKITEKQSLTKMVGD